MNSFNINQTNYFIDDTIDNNSFVGIKIVNGIYHLCFPIGYKVKQGNEKYYKQVLRYLYKTILLSKRILTNNESKSLKNEKSIPLYSYIYILSDFFSNGVYSFNEVKYRKNIIGKINWKRTFKNQFYVQDSTPIYLDNVIRYNKKETNIITLLQLYAVNKAIDMLVFMGDFNKPYSELSDNDIKQNINYYNIILDKELRNTNSDKKKLLLINIKKIINDCSNSDSSIRSFGTYSYEYSFEKMIDKLFGSEENLSKYYPTALWYIDGDREGLESSKLREDTIWKGESRIYIIDSKYYRYGLDNDNTFLPKTSDIHKQIVYGDYVFNKLLKEENKKYDIYNVFIIPSNKDEFLEYKGYTKMKLLDDDKDYKYVYLLFINMNELIDKYFKKEYNLIDKMIKVIEDNKIKK